VITADGESVVTDGPFGLSFDVFCAGGDLGEDRLQQVTIPVEAVCGDESAPLPTDIERIAVWSGFDEGPAQLGYIFHSSSRTCLLPVDQTNRPSAANDNIPRLQIVVDYRFEAID
jgi:hypothetical protein